MSDVITPEPGMTSVPSTPAARSPAQEKVHVPISIGDRVHIPGWVVDLGSFRRWARSDDFPDRGRFAFLSRTLYSQALACKLTNAPRMATWRKKELNL
jgi:hypothetical protein